MTSNPTASAADLASLTVADLAVTAEEHWPHYAEDEVDGVVAALRSGKVNQWTGSKVVEFQAAYEQYVGHGRHAIALTNGSVALELALRAFGVGEGDEVIVTPRTFVASASCVRLVGATPVFADVDPESGNITPATIEAVVTDRTKGVIPVHLAGWPADMHGINAVAKQHELFVLEDCAQAHGAEIDGQPVGSFSEAAAFSFCQDKIMSTGGEGGLTLFRDEPAYRWAWEYKDHGKSLDKIRDKHPAPGFRWLHDSVGTNWRMLEMSAVIGIAQLGKLDEWRAARTERANVWRTAFDGIDGLRVPQLPEGITHAEYKFYSYVERGVESEALRNEIVARAGARGIRAFSGSCSEVYLEDAFGDLHVDRLPVARRLGETSLMFEVHPTLDLERLRLRAAVVAEIAREVLA
ncbi:MAG: DegT/DnrJ/EryC1/StrS aminotransferase family protein [Thermoleophilia bacterium]|nr:DegT/DnrJ/EryC1/StrS aminotransferase family protein [Thermoleophilia bacterium]